MSAQAIFIEAGHGISNSFLGGPDLGASGKIGNGKVYERDFAVRIARKVLSIMKSKEELNGLIVQGVGIETSASISKKMKFVNTVITENHLDPTKCFGVAIHMNAAGDTQSHGFEVWYQKSMKSLGFGNSIVDSWREYAITALRPRPVNSSAVGRYGRFYIDDTQARYVIIETGFITNETEAAKINENIDRVAEAIAHGILQFVRSLTTQNA